MFTIFFFPPLLLLPLCVFTSLADRTPAVAFFCLAREGGKRFRGKAAGAGFRRVRI
jgi:hypothetical protein